MKSRNVFVIGHKDKPKLLNKPIKPPNDQTQVHQIGE